MNGILTRQMKLLAGTESDLKPIFHNITDLMATMAPKADKLTIVYSILAKTKPDHWGAQTNRTNSKLSDIPPLMEAGLPIVLMLYTGTDDEPVDYRSIGIGPNIPVFRNRLQRILNRATQEASIHLLCSVTTEENHQQVSKPPNHEAYGQKASSTR